MSFRTSPMSQDNRLLLLRFQTIDRISVYGSTVANPRYSVQESFSAGNTYFVCWNEFWTMQNGEVPARSLHIVAVTEFGSIKHIIVWSDQKTQNRFSLSSLSIPGFTFTQLARSTSSTHHTHTAEHYNINKSSTNYIFWHFCCSPAQKALLLFLSRPQSEI